MLDKWSLETPVVDRRDARKSEHLLQGIRPITACIGAPKDHRLNPELSPDAFPETTQHVAGHRNVDYSGDSEALQREGFKNVGVRSFVISPVDDADKFSQGFYECMGLIVTGRSADTGKDVSFLVHTDPFFFWDSMVQQGVFLQALGERMEELKGRCIVGTIDAVIIGGDSAPDRAKQRAYRESIKLISEEVTNILGFEPAVLTGPKLDAHREKSHAENVYYDNEHRRAYIMREKSGDTSSESFLARDVRAQEEKWQKEWKENKEYMIEEKKEDE